MYTREHVRAHTHKIHSRTHTHARMHMRMDTSARSAGSTALGQLSPIAALAAASRCKVTAWPGAGEALSTAEYFDGSHWAVLPPMRDARLGCTLVRLHRLDAVPRRTPTRTRMHAHILSPHTPRAKAR
jgi:hypothetical protein